MFLEKSKKIEVKISGMTCAMCATTIEKSLINLDGVINGQVNLGNESVVVEYDFLKLRFTDLDKAIKNAGYQIINEKVVLKIGGMTCATCVKTIENSLLRLDGIIEVNIDLAGEKTIVIYNPNIVTQAEMRRAIKETGYQFLGIEGEETEDFEKVTREKDLKEKRNRIIVGFTTGTLLMILMYIPTNLSISTAYLMLLISTPAFIYISHPIFAAAYRSLKNKNLNMDVMYSMGIGVAFNNKMAGMIAITDTLKGTTKSAIKKFKDMEFNIFMITGDNIRTANAIAKQAGIVEVLAEVLPQDKANEVKKLQEKGEVVAFVGDGINDAPALAQADVGIAIGSGTDVAIETGDIVLIKDDLLDAVAAVQLSKKVISRIKQNIFWAFAYNTALIPVAAGILYPFFGITFRPELAGLAMAMSSVTVISLSLMLKKYVPPVKEITI